jgi:hypothetical protein
MVYSQTVTGADAESASGFLPQIPFVDLDAVLASLNPTFPDAKKEGELFRAYIQRHDESVFARWMDVYDSLVGDSTTYNSEKVSFSGQGTNHPEYHFSIGLLKYSTAEDEHSLDDVFFEVQDRSARAGARARFRSNGSIYNHETIASQNLADMCKELERSERFSSFKRELYDLLFPSQENT